MKLASIGRLKIAWYEEQKSATSNQVLCTEVLLCAKCDRQGYTTYGVRSLAGHDPVEGFITSGHLLKSNSTLRSISLKMMFRLLPPLMRVLDN
jgi:hypothetical protein